MKDPHRRKAEDLFENAWRRRLERPVRTLPTEAAARIAAHVGSRRRSPLSRWIPLAAAAALALAVGTTLLRDPGPPPLPPAAGVPGDLPLGEGEILLWLDTSTPLYMTFQPPAAAPSPEEKS
ncbi:MAG: hypothetical protein FJW35_18465 [Acidobacteria bacterium]|nr:hypothetical protein [Acidobacteriota bacterium]